jgi:hypothetical protein
MHVPFPYFTLRKYGTFFLYLNFLSRQQYAVFSSLGSASITRYPLCHCVRISGLSTVV